MHRRQQRLGALIGRLRVRDLRGAERAAGAERHVHAPRELAGAEDRERRLRRAEGRRAGLHRQRRDEGAEDHRRAGADELQKAVPASTSASTCVSVPATVTGLIAPDRMNGVMMQAWLFCGVDLGRAEHGGVPDQRRVGVDQAGHDRVVADEILAEQDLGTSAPCPRRARDA